jgi:hypothetical protein
MGDTVSWALAGAVIIAVAIAVAAVRLALAADQARRARAWEAAAAMAQYGLLFGFAAVAAAISAHGLTGFARASMGLRGPWPYLLWGALNGAAGLCAVLLMRRAARGESAVAPRLAVWGLTPSGRSYFEEIGVDGELVVAQLPIRIVRSIHRIRSQVSWGESSSVRGVCLGAFSEASRRRNPGFDTTSAAARLVRAKGQHR